MKYLLFDFSRVLLFLKDEKKGLSLNELHSLNAGDDNYNFYDYFKFNDELLDYLANNTNRFKYYIFTTGNIQNTPESKAKLDGIFENIFSVMETGLSKKDPKSYTNIAKMIGIDPKEIIFIDDTKSNTSAAKLAGLQTLQYNNNNELISLLNDQ